MNSMVAATQPVTKTYRRFAFPGFVNEGTCYVRVHVGHHSITALIAQLRNYHGTFIQNAYEDIAPLVAAQIAEDIDIDHLRAPRPWWHLGARPKASPGEVMAKTKWLEHYPPGTGLHPAGSFAVVELNPTIDWHYCSRQAAQKHCDVPSEFFDIDPGDLDFKAP